MKGVLSKRQRERKRRRDELSKLIGKRMDDWRSFVKKDNDSQLTEEQRDRKEGDKLVKEMDKRLND